MAVMDILRSAHNGEFFADAGRAAGIDAAEQAASEVTQELGTHRKRTTRRRTTPSLDQIFGELLGINRR